MTSKNVLDASRDWAERQRRTNRLVRITADYLLHQTGMSADQLHGLCKLTWITKSYDGADAGYIRTVKIPALGQIYSRDYSHASLDQVAEDVSNVLASRSCKQLILGHTGFTNFYPPYRNSSRQWVKDHFATLLPLFRQAWELNTDALGLKLIRAITGLPRIPIAGNGASQMQPQSLLTPVFFALDKRVRFPLLNGNPGVRKLLATLKVQSASLEQQYRQMISLYGRGGINDAADLDQVGRDPSDFLDVVEEKPRKRLLELKPISGRAPLPLKDESDIESLQKARSITSRRIHNKLTNKLRACLSHHDLHEGCDKSAMFDVLVKHYDDDANDLLIEVKSSVEVAHIRMAVGQLLDYWFRAYGDSDRHLAVLVPESPNDQVRQMLKWLNIGVLWFSGDRLKTCTQWLRSLADQT